MKLKKYELEQLLSHLLSILDYKTDPYAEDHEIILQSRDLIAKALGEKEVMGIYNFPQFTKPKRKLK